MSLAVYFLVVEWQSRVFQSSIRSIKYLAVDLALPPVEVAFTVAHFHLRARKLSVPAVELDLRADSFGIRFSAHISHIIQCG